VEWVIVKWKGVKSFDSWRDSCYTCQHGGREYSDGAGRTMTVSRQLVHSPCYTRKTRGADRRAVADGLWDGLAVGSQYSNVEMIRPAVYAIV
jgi:hypothetical protein